MNAPEEPIGADRMTQWLRKLVRYCRSNEVIDSPDILVSKGLRGTFLEFRNRKRAISQPVQWKGEWLQTSTYQENDIVIRGSNNLSSAAWNDADNILKDGAKAGVFIALQSVPAGIEPIEPNTNVYWETLARFGTHIIALVKGPVTPASQKITIDSTTPNGTVEINLRDCNGKALSIREVAVCTSSGEKRMMVLGSAPY